MKAFPLKMVDIVWKRDPSDLAEFPMKTGPGDEGDWGGMGDWRTGGRGDGEPFSSVSLFVKRLEDPSIINSTVIEILYSSSL